MSDTAQAIDNEDDDSFMDWETRNEHIPIGKHIIAGKLLFNSHLTCRTIGSCAGIMEHVGMFPMDTIKVIILQITLFQLFKFYDCAYTDPYASKWSFTQRFQNCKNSLSGRRLVSFLERCSSHGEWLCTCPCQLLLVLWAFETIPTSRPLRAEFSLDIDDWWLYYVCAWLFYRSSRR